MLYKKLRKNTGSIETFVMEYSYTKPIEKKHQLGDGCMESVATN